MDGTQTVAIPSWVACLETESSPNFNCNSSGGSRSFIRPWSIVHSTLNKSLKLLAHYSIMHLSKKWPHPNPSPEERDSTPLLLFGEGLGMRLYFIWRTEIGHLHSL